MLINEKLLRILIEDIQRLVEAPPLDQFGALPVSSDDDDDDQQPYKVPIKNRKRVIPQDKKFRPKIKRLKGVSSSGMPEGMKIREKDFRKLFEPFPYDVNIFTVQSTDATGLTNDQVDTIFKKLRDTENFNPTIAKRSTNPNVMSNIQHELQKYITHIDSIYQPDNFIRLVRKVSLENSCKVIKKGLESTAKEALNVLNTPMANEPDNIKFPNMSDASLSSLEPQAFASEKHVTRLLSIPDNFKLSDRINYEPTGRQYSEYVGGYESRAMYYGIFVRDAFTSTPIESAMHRHYANKNSRSKHAKDYDYEVRRSRNYGRSSERPFGIDVTDQDLTSKEPFRLRHPNQNWINNDDHFHVQLEDYFKNIERSLTNHFKHLAARAHVLASIVKPERVFEDYRKQIQQVLRLKVAYAKFKDENIPYSVYDYYELEGITEEEAKASPERYEEIKAIVEKNYNDLKKQIKSYEDKAVEDFKYHVFSNTDGDINTTRSGSEGFFRDTKANYNDFKKLGANETVGEFGRSEKYPALHYPMSGGFYELSSEEKDIIDSLYTNSVLKSLEDIYHNSIENSTISNIDIDDDHEYAHGIVRRYIILLIKKISFIIESSTYMSSFEKLFGTKYTNSTSDSPYYTALPSILSSLENCAKAYQNFLNLEAKNKNSFNEINVELDLQYEYDPADKSIGFSKPGGRRSSFVDKESFLKLIKSMNMVNAEGNIESLEDSFNKSIIPVLKQEIYSSFFEERGEVSSGRVGVYEGIKQFVIKFSKSVTGLDSFLNSYQKILDGLDVDGTPIGDFPEGIIDNRNIPGASLKQTGVDEFRFTLKYSQFQKQFPFMKDAAIKNGITIIYFMTKDTSMSFTPEETTAFGVTLDPQSVAHDISHIIDDYKEHEAYRKFRDGDGDERRNKERRTTGTTGLINDANRETLAALANEYIGLTQVCSSLPDIKVKMPDNDEILTDFWVSSGIFGSLRDVRRRMFSRQDSLHEFFGSYIENLSKNKEGIEKHYPPVLPVTDPRRGGGVGQDPFLQSIVGRDFISLQNIDRTRGQLMVSDDTYEIRDEKDEAYDSIIDLFEKTGGRTPENKVDLTKRHSGVFALEYVKRQQLLLIKNNREFLINIYVPSEDGDWWDESDSSLAVSGELDSTLFFRENSQDELDMDEIMDALGDEINTVDPHFNLQDYLDDLDIDDLDLDLDFGSVVKVTEIGVCRAYQFYKVCDAYGQYSDYFAIEDPKNLLDNNIMRGELTEILRQWERMDGNAIGYVKWDDNEYGDSSSWDNTGIIDFVINNPGENQKFKRGFVSNMCGKIIIDINEIDRENIVNDIQEPIAKDQFIELLKSIEEPFLTQQGIDKSKKYLESLGEKYHNEDESKTRVERWGALSLETIFKHIDDLDMEQKNTLHDIIRENYNPNVIEKIKKLNAGDVKGLLYSNSPYVMCMILGLSGKQTFEAINEKLLKFYSRKWGGYEDGPQETDSYGKPYHQIKFKPTEYSRQILKSIGEDEIKINSIDLFSGKSIKSDKLNIEFNLNDLQYPVNHGGQTNTENEYVIENTKAGEFIRHISANSDTAYERFGFSHYRGGSGLEVKYYPFKSVVETNKPLFKYFMTIGFDLVGGEDYYQSMFGGDTSGILQALMTKFKQKRKQRPAVQANISGESNYEASSSTESGYREFAAGSFERRREIIDKVHDIYSSIFKDIMTPEVVFDDNEGLVSLQILAGN